MESSLFIVFPSKIRQLCVYGLFRPDLDRHDRKLLMEGETKLYDRLRRKGETGLYYPGAVVYDCPDGARFTKQELRRWHFRIGEWRFAREDEPAGGRAPAVWGVPGWRYSLTLQHGFAVLACTVKGRHAEAFYQEIQGITCAWDIFGAVKASLRTVAAAKEKKVGGR